MSQRPWLCVVIVFLAFSLAPQITKPAGSNVSPVTHNEVFQ
jgi:hypothetical protein